MASGPLGRCRACLSRGHRAGGREHSGVTRGGTCGSGEHADESTLTSAMEDETVVRGIYKGETWRFLLRRGLHLGLRIRN